MNNISLPGYTAEASLNASPERYRVQVLGASGNTLTVQPQTVQIMRKGNCWCDEPDTRVMCQGGTCRTLPVCLQWSCPSSGLDDFPGGTTVGTLGS